MNDKGSIENKETSLLDWILKIGCILFFYFIFCFPAIMGTIDQYLYDQSELKNQAKEVGEVNSIVE